MKQILISQWDTYLRTENLSLLPLKISRNDRFSNHKYVLVLILIHAVSDKVHRETEVS